MPELTDERDRALQLHNVLFTALGREATDGLATSRVQAWLEVEKFILRSHACQPVWRPVSFDEIQAGWEVRSRRRDGSEAAWGVAHHQNNEGDWLSEAETMLTYTLLKWTYETTEPEPKPDPLVASVLEWSEDSEGVTVDPCRTGRPAARVPRRPRLGHVHQRPSGDSPLLKVRDRVGLDEPAES